MTSTLEKSMERGQELLQEARGYPSKQEEMGTKQQNFPTTQAHSRHRHQHLKPGCPQIGAIVAGFPSPLANELAQYLSKSGVKVSNIGLGSRPSQRTSASTTSTTSQQQQQKTTQQQQQGQQGQQQPEQQDIEGMNKIEVIDCEAPDVRDQLERAKDMLEKEGSEVVIVLDVSQDCSGIELYNRLKLPFIHSGSENLAEELKMYEITTTARNPCVISPFIAREAAMLQLMLETFARAHPGLFKGWQLDQDMSYAENNAVGAAKRRSQNLLSYLTDQDPSSFSKWTSGKGSLYTTDEKSEQQQHQQQQQQQGSSGGGVLEKLGLKSAVESAKSAVSSATSAVTGTNQHAGFTLRSPDGKHSFTVSHEHHCLAEVKSVLQMAEFLADKIVKGREPRVWGIKDWVPGIDAINRQVAECCEKGQLSGGAQQQQSQPFETKGGRHGGHAHIVGTSQQQQYQYQPGAQGQNVSEGQTPMAQSSPYGNIQQQTKGGPTTVTVTDTSATNE